MARKGHDPHRSWFHDRIQSDHGAIIKGCCEAKITEILRDRARYPSPIRPVGSRHSMTPCMSAEGSGDDGTKHWGTLVDMTALTALRDGSGEPGTHTLRVTPDASGESASVTVPAGRTFFDVASELNEQEPPWMFRVNTELGPLTVGAAACGATKDSSFHGESGQVCHDVIGMRLIRPDGRAEDIDETHRDLPALRCSYGLFGIVTEVTFRVYRKYYVSMEHREIAPENGQTFTPRELQRHFDDWIGPRDNENAVFLYMFPYRDRIVAEIRKKPITEGTPREKSLWLTVRNFFWDQGSHDWEKFARRYRVLFLHRFLQDRFRKRLQDLFGIVLSWGLTTFLNIKRLNPVAQIVDFDPQDDEHRFTFSMWAFPEHEFAEILPQYFALCREHEGTFRTGLPHASYHIGVDRSSVLSYSRHGAVWTLDPICPDNIPGWHPFLDEFNKLCSELRGIPLLNQTPRLTRAQVACAFGDVLPEFEATRREFDPGGRMLNVYFEDLLDASAPAASVAA